MKRLLTVAAAAALIFALFACDKPLPDSSGKYILNSEGEAVIDGVDMTFCDPEPGNERVFYEIFVGSFSDSDGDGIGDLRGIINRFDYLNDGDPASGVSLGVEGIWLTPVFRSSSYHKYNVIDYYGIDPDFGTEDDFKELISLCHERGVKLIIDLPINHTSELNQWFIKFASSHREGDTESEYYGFYSYYTEGEAAPAGRQFKKVSGTDIYYECNFADSMPELDFDNDKVRAAVLDVAKHYLEMGVDGFRFDAAKYIYLGDNAKSAEFWKWYVGELRKISPDVYTVAEVWDSDGITDKYFGATDCFNFTTSQSSGLIASTADAGNVNTYTSYVEKYVERVKSERESAMLVSFLTNHDMDRAAGFLPAASGNNFVAANLYLLTPGSPFIYYGEELGMRGSRGAASTDANRRLAMLWGDGDTVKNPEGSTYPASSQTENTVESVKGDGDSLYNHYKKLIMVRKANPEIACGKYTALSFENTKLGGFISTADSGTVCVIHNTTARELSVDLSEVTDISFGGITAYLGGDATLDGNLLTISAKTSVVLR